MSGRRSAGADGVPDSTPRLGRRAVFSGGDARSTAAGDRP